MNYAAKQFCYLLECGPYPGEDFFRLQATGNGSTKHVNITPQQLEKIVGILNDKESDDD